MGLSSGKCLSETRLDGCTAVVTGANTGIGKLTAKDFYRRGARVVLACRSVEKGRQAAKEIAEDAEGAGELVVVELDLSDLASARKCAEELLSTEKKIDLLVNNAGVMMCPEGKTKDGFEMQFGTNHLGHFLFTMLLLGRIVDSVPARIINVSSMAHLGGVIDFEDLNWEKKRYSAVGAYAQSKLANILFTKELARRIKEAGISGLTVYSLHPGVVHTELGRHLPDTYFRGAQLFYKWFSWLMKTPEEGAQTTIYCAVDEKAGKETGLYYDNCVVRTPSREALKADDAVRLWETSLELVGLGKEFDPFEKK